MGQILLNEMTQSIETLGFLGGSCGEGKGGVIENANTLLKTRGTGELRGGEFYRQWEAGKRREFEKQKEKN